MPTNTKQDDNNEPEPTKGEPEQTKTKPEPEPEPDPSPKKMVEEADLRELRERLKELETNQSKTVSLLEQFFGESAPEEPEEKKNWIEAALDELNESWGFLDSES